tara:strand:- start:340 stop:657 length:318 start_codon:yes stop_codon:yes gene_type:complete
MITKTNNKHITTYNPNVVNSEITHWDKQEDWSVGDIINVTIKEWNGYKYYVTKAKMKLKQFINYDNRPEGLIPNQEKSYSITQEKLVPNRYIWKVEWIVNNHSFF